jgi:hydroxymethylbilane synthase
MEKIIIGTRGSDLALWQARFLQSELLSIGIESKLEIIKTRGDKIQHLSFDKIEGKGFFTKELEVALLENRIHLAVHSMKDLPTSHPEGLVVTGVSHRANPQDVLLIREQSVSETEPLSLKSMAIVGTSSARRKAQIIDLKPDIVIKDIRGNVPTRIAKLREGQFDAILLAAAGIERLGLDLSGLKRINLHPREFVPAPAQGILAYQCHEENLEVRRIVQKIHHSEVASCSNIERKVLQKMEGGCHLPLGVHCFKDAMDNYHCYAAFSTAIDQPLVKTFISQSTSVGLAEKIYNHLTHG